MALYVPQSFSVDDRTAINRLIRDHPFATLVTPATPEPWVSHLPLLLKDGDSRLIGHFARANPHWGHVGGIGSIAIFHRPHPYVSPSWSDGPAPALPTAYVTSVH